MLNILFFGVSDVRSKGKYFWLAAAVESSVEKNGLELFRKTKLVFSVFNFLEHINGERIRYYNLVNSILDILENIISLLSHF